MSWAFSFSSSMRENLVSLRRRNSRMYSAWISDRSKAVCSRSRAEPLSSELTDDLDDVVDIENRDQEAIYQVQAVAASA